MSSMIRFRMVKINVDQFATLVNYFPDEGLSYTVEVGFKSASSAKRIACVFSIELAHDERTILKLAISCEYDIQPDDWINRITNNTLIINKAELGFFANQTVGVARGVMFCKTEETPFSQFIMPPINLTKLIKEDFVIELADS